MTQISTTGKSSKDSRTKTRIQKENETRILTAALDVFSERGFRGATLDRIASAANMSKPNPSLLLGGQRRDPRGASERPA